MPQTEPSLIPEHSVDAEVSLAFAWDYRTDITKWNDPPAVFSLEGPFAAGSRGTTQMPGQAPVHWRIRDVTPNESFVSEVDLDRVTPPAKRRQVAALQI
jgi:hypothetical protein